MRESLLADADGLFLWAIVSRVVYNTSIGQQEAHCPATRRSLAGFVEKSAAKMVKE
jgi:hypothetical protein